MLCAISQYLTRQLKTITYKKKDILRSALIGRILFLFICAFAIYNKAVLMSIAYEKGIVGVLNL